MKVIYIDNSIVVCEKAAGELSEGEGKGCLPMLLRSHMESIGEKNTDIFPVHRLDRDTVGVTVYARSARAAAALSESIRGGELSKEYLALVCGTPEQNEGIMSDLLFYDRRRGKSYVVDRERSGVKKALLDYSLIKTDGAYSLISIRLHTGRTHQIRVQFASRGMPLVGDRRYGAPKDERRSVALLAYRLSFPHPEDGRTVMFVSEDTSAVDL